MPSCCCGQVALATGLGIVLLRASTGMEPLASATAGDLAGPMADAMASLLRPVGNAGS